MDPLNKKKHLLFICTANVCRSPLAAELFEDSKGYEARSAGIHILHAEYPHSISVTQEMIDWADEILVMSEKEDHHLTYLKKHFSLDEKNITILGIPNDYDTFIKEQKDELIRILKERLSSYLSNVTP